MAISVSFMDAPKWWLGGYDGLSVGASSFRKNAMTWSFVTSLLATPSVNASISLTGYSASTLFISRNAMAACVPVRLLPSANAWFWTMWNRYAAAIAATS